MTRKHEPTDAGRETIRALASFGIPQRRMAAYLRIDKKTLTKHYRDELDEAGVAADLAVVKNLHRIASESDNPTAAIYWTKARLGWKEAKDEPPPPKEDEAKHVDKPKGETVDEWRARRERESK